MTLPENSTHEESKVLVFEVAIPDIDAEALAEMYENNGDGGVPLLFFLGHASTEVSLVASWQDDEDRVHLESYQGFIVRSRISDEAWVQLTSDFNEDNARR